jgi:3-isopropylmalate/(R)-2-methylmalate dehydratase small subunit
LKSIRHGEEMEIDLEKGTIVRLMTGGVIETERFPPVLKEIVERRGIDAYLKSKLKR